MKPPWGTRTWGGSQGSASMLGATLGFEMQPLRGKSEMSKPFKAVLKVKN